MDDVKSDSGTQDYGEIEVILWNKRTGEIKHQEILPVEAPKWQ